MVDGLLPPVPFLRPFEWVAPTLTAFRERPLPSIYQTSVQPTFDIFSNSRVNEVLFEQVLGTLGLLEVVLSQVPQGFYRQYLSFAFVHNDVAAAGRILFPIRIIADPSLGFPFAPLQAPLEDGNVPANHWGVVRNASVPPEGFIGARVNALNPGTRLTLRALFLELPVGEPYGGIS